MITAHNPEVAGSNQTPATNENAANSRHSSSSAYLQTNGPQIYRSNSIPHLGLAHLQVWVAIGTAPGWPLAALRLSRLDYEFDVVVYGDNVPSASAKFLLKLEHDHRQDQKRFVLTVLEKP
jgi:hypothetical protein